MTFQPLLNCWYLSGPTASGKSAVGVELAEILGAEIIALDSMTLYRRMDIGTAKPTPQECARVPHHLVDIIDPSEDFSLAQYIEVAHRTVEEINRRGRIALFVGGTPLYLKGLLRGIFQGPPADWPFRRQLQHQARQQAPDWLHRRLQAVDPLSALRLHANDTRRLIRALEVFHLTGRPISELQKQFDIGTAAQNCRVFVLDWTREELHLRITRRVCEMFEQGLVDEVRRLLSAPKPLGKTARQAVGYREVIEHLDGKYSLAKTKELIEQHTRQLAKRQRTWFRSLCECRLVSVTEQLDPREVARLIYGQ
ncbi:MAG: tRNA (adenosine(37)-N6)-dimethylallyltransferase MiaA [Thermoguttaceae bacterium]